MCSWLLYRENEDVRISYTIVPRFFRFLVRFHFQFYVAVNVKQRLLYIVPGTLNERNTQLQNAKSSRNGLSVLSRLHDYCNAL